MKSIMFLCNVPDGRIEKALEKAAELGIRSIFCGEEDARVRNLADAYYLMKEIDIGELVRLAKQERVDGVIGLSDPYVLPAAEVAQALGLPGNSPESLKMLISKDSFRNLQERAGLFCPKHAAYADLSQIGDTLEDFQYPLIVKPRLCSSSFGQTILSDDRALKEAFQTAAEKSRDGYVCIEEYIEPRSLRTVEADIFVVGDDILWEGIRDSWHSESAVTRPLYDVYPVHLTEDEMEIFRKEVSGAVRAAGVRLGEYNVEGFFTHGGEFFVVEINARQSGYYNPQHIQLCSGVDLTGLLLSTAVGDMGYYEELKTFRRTAEKILSYSIFAGEDGRLDHVHIAPEMRARMLSYDSLEHPEKGDMVRDYKTARWPIAQVAFRFDTEEELEEARSRIEDLVYVVLQ